MIEFYELNSINDELLEFAVIYSMYKNEWVFVKHKDRTTWEMPGICQDSLHQRKP